MTDKESRIAERMRIRGSAKLQPKTPVPKTIAKPSRSQPTRTGLSEKIPSRYCALPGFFVSRNGSVGPSQSPTTAFTQSQTGARDRTEGSFMARSRPCHAAWEPCDRLPFAPKKSSAAQTSTTVVDRRSAETNLAFDSGSTWLGIDVVFSTGTNAAGVQGRAIRATTFR